MSIPPTMAFYWHGGPMSWLRLQTLQTFARLHPGWDLVPIPPIRGRDDLPVDTRADLARWDWLAVNGGWFMDLDVIWLSPLDPLCEAEMRLTTDGGTWYRKDPATGIGFAIGVVGAEANHPLVAAVAQSAWAAASKRDHQSAGTRLLAEQWEQLPGRCRVSPLPAASLYPFGELASGRDRAWLAGSDLPDGLLGLHWSGGHPLSRDMEPGVSVTWMQVSRCPVAQALRRAYA